MMMLACRPEKYVAIVSSTALAALLLLLMQLLSQDDVISDSSTVKEYATEYCNIPTGDSETTASEGKQPPGTILVSVAVVLRHGDRFLMEKTRMGSLGAPPVSCRLSKHDNSHPLVGKFIVDMDKMMGTSRRTDVTDWDYPPYPNSTLCRPELLSPAGVEQHLRNGLLLRNAYKKKISLAKVIVKSTKYLRTYQSALAFLYGLNRKLSWSQLDIEPVSSHTFCSPERMGDCTCPNVDKLSAEAYDQVKRQWQKKDVAYSKFFQRVYSILNADTPVEYPWESALDFLAQFSCRKLALPCKHGGCFEEEDFGLLWEHHTFFQRKLAFNEAFQRQSRIAMHPLLAEIAAHMESIQTGKAEPPWPMLIYSGHDITLTPLAKALGVPLGKWPPYASRLVIEHYKDLTGNRHYIRVLFNGEDVTRWLYFYRDVGNGLCPLEDFIAFAKDEIIRDLGYNDWRAACFDVRYDPRIDNDLAEVLEGTK